MDFDSIFDDWYFEDWCKNKENNATRAYMEMSPNDVKPLRKVMKEAFDAALKIIDKSKNM